VHPLDPLFLEGFNRTAREKRQLKIMEEPAPMLPGLPRALPPVPHHLISRLPEFEKGLKNVGKIVAW
jgi:hypothetical protein